MYATHCRELSYITVKHHDYILKVIQVTTVRTRICIKSIKGEIIQKVIQRELSSLFATHYHYLLYCEASSKYSKRYSSYLADTKMLTEGRTYGRTDARLIAISPEPFGRGLKTDYYSSSL